MMTRKTSFKRFLVAALSGLCGLAGFAPAALANDQVRITQGGDTATSKSLVLSLNKSAIIELPEAAADVLVSNPGTVDAIIRSPKRVYLLGLQVGQTNAFFFDSRNRQILNLEIRVERDLDALSDLYSKLIPTSRVELESVNENVILRGSVENNSDAERVAEIAGRYVGDPAKVMNMVSVRETSQVMLKVRIVEMQRRLVKQLGVNTNTFARLDDSTLSLNFQSSFGVNAEALGGLAAQLNTPGFDDLSPLNFSIDAFEQSGLVRTLAEPTLTSVSGEGATFLAGGEFPVPVNRDGDETTVAFKKFGVSLGFRPVVLSKGRINMKIETEVSEISAANGFALAAGSSVDPDTGEETSFSGFIIPGLTVRRVENTVELPSGGSLAVAGLLQENIQSAIDGTPGLKETPVLGQLFRSQDFVNEETELVIIVTPYLINPTTEDKLADPAKDHVLPTTVQQALLGRMESVYGMKNRGVDAPTLQGPVGFILD
jgi:pilus assembly protein CpaC